MPEIFQDAALYYPIGNSDALAQRIKMVLEMNREETEKWRKAARLRSSFFSWDKCANETLEVLQHVFRDYWK
jgi:glycosyltransferase involved in cell wall biosynthesis